jgi:Phospholipase_D-nuclease N-terminal
MPVIFVILLCVAAVALGAVLLFLLPVFLAVLIFALSILLCVFWIWMLVDAIKNQGLGEGEKIGWVLAIVFLHFIGSTLYFFLGRPKGNAARAT